MEKYVVFKKEEFDNYFQDTRVHYGLVPLKDAHVIREQDIFAAPVLSTYASSVQTAIEILQHAGQVPPDYLYKARDHFFEAARSAEANTTKGFPDE